MAAHRLALEHVPRVDFDRYIPSATNAPAVVRRHVPGYEPEYARRGWSMLPAQYPCLCQRAGAGPAGLYDFRHALGCLRRGEDFFSPLARAVGSKGYHAQVFEAGPDPTE